MNIGYPKLNKSLARDNLVIRNLSSTLLAAPVIASFACIAIAQSNKNELRIAEQPITISLAKAIVITKTTFEPKSFKQEVSAPLQWSLAKLPLDAGRKFPLTLPAIDATTNPSQTAKSRLMAPRKTTPAKILLASRVGLVKIGEKTHTKTSGKLISGTRVLVEARAVAANAVTADGKVFYLEGIKPTRSGATCKRIDGVVQSCSERAQHRLNILLSGRRVTCDLTKEYSSHEFVGRCFAGKINIASDLLRYKLVRKVTVDEVRNRL